MTALVIGLLVSFGVWWALALVAPTDVDPAGVALAAAIAAACLGAAAGLAAA